jgi:hypothetical protein
MTELELENKATLYANEHCEDKDIFWLSDEEMLRRAFIAGAKAMQEEKEQLKLELETNLSSLKEIVELLQQIEKMKCWKLAE